MHQSHHLVAPVHPAFSKKGHIRHGYVDHVLGRGVELLGPQRQRLQVCQRHPRVRCLCESGRYPGATKERRESLSSRWFQVWGDIRHGVIERTYGSEKEWMDRRIGGRRRGGKRGEPSE